MVWICLHSIWVFMRQIELLVKFFCAYFDISLRVFGQKEGETTRQIAHAACSKRYVYVSDGVFLVQITAY